MIFDTILEIDNIVNEAGGDTRVNFSTTPTMQNIDFYRGSDPNAQFAYGQIVKRNLESGLGTGYGVKVADFNTDVVVEVSYNDVKTGRTAQKLFLIKLSNKKGNGVVKAQSNRFRTINGIDQAVSYIRSSSMSLRNLTAKES